MLVKENSDKKTMIERENKKSFSGLKGFWKFEGAVLLWDLNK